jgi:MSHA pilin protein MshD
MSSPTERRCPGQRGISLLELILFIVIVGAGIAGVLGVWRVTAQGSADPLIQKQALAIAEAYLEEALAMPFTYCDPDDLHAATAQSDAAVNPADPTRCASTLEAIGAEPGESRGSTTTPYDNVNDYASLPAAAPANIDGSAIPGLGAYQVAVAVVGQSLSNGSATVPAAASQRVTVTVTGPGNTTVTLDGYRTRYAPNALP